MTWAKLVLCISGTVSSVIAVSYTSLIKKKKKTLLPHFFFLSLDLLKLVYLVARPLNQSELTLSGYKLRYHTNHVLGPVLWKSRNFSGLSPFISSQYRSSKPSHFATLFSFLFCFFTLKTCQKIISFSKQADRNVTSGFSGPKSSQDFWEKCPRPLSLQCHLQPLFCPKAWQLCAHKGKKVCLPNEYLSTKKKYFVSFTRKKLMTMENYYWKQLLKGMFSNDQKRIVPKLKWCLILWIKS